MCTVMDGWPGLHLDRGGTIELIGEPALDRGVKNAR
jgi:hypothetical protein